MKRLLTLKLASLFLVIFAVTTVQAGWDPDKEKDAQETISKFRQKDPKLKRFFKRAYGYAVFPTVAKGGIGIGAAYGSGVVYKKGKSKKGKAIGTASLTQVTIGFQLGGQAYSEIIFFQSKRALDDFTEGNFELNAQASAVAITFGASADADYSNGVAIFTLAKGGLMYEASVGGQKFSYSPK